MTKDKDRKESQPLKHSEGLCSTCKNEALCAHQEEYARPVWDCNEFEVCPSPSGVITDEFIAGLLQKTREPGERNSDNYAGLCKNCDKRMTCVHTRPGAGVWHCEEYK